MNLAVNDHPEQPDEPHEADPAAMGFPALAQQVAGDVEDLLERAEFVNDDFARLTSDFESESAVTVLNLEDEVPWSPNELLAQLNGIAATAYRIARNLHPLIELRSRHLIARAGQETSHRPTDPDGSA